MENAEVSLRSDAVKTEASRLRNRSVKGNIQIENITFMQGVFGMDDLHIVNSIYTAYLST